MTVLCAKHRLFLPCGVCEFERGERPDCQAIKRDVFVPIGVGCVRRGDVITGFDVRDGVSGVMLERTVYRVKAPIQRISADEYFWLGSQWIPSELNQVCRDRRLQWAR